jgi:PPOX class probable F420-dependent enzyme
VLDERLRALCKGENYGVLTTLFSDGRPQSQIMWIDCDDEHVIINTEVHRAKYKNLAADPRVAITIWKADDPTAYFEVRGTVADVVIGDEAKAHLDSLAQRYFKVDEYPYPIETQRAIVRIAPDRIVSFPP